VLATLSLHGREDAGPRAARLSGDQAQIADYLVEEVLERQPEHLKRFLLGTSILERMTASLCDAVLGTTDAAGSLEAVARSNAFVVPIDDHREWYRYHHLFGDLLRAELGRRHPELLRVYRRRAARWCELHGTPDRAFFYAYESGDCSGRPNRACASGRVCDAWAE
jgi:LuxR family maltose regulon positive regulatory protein